MNSPKAAHESAVHEEHVAHHFHSAAQQFAAGKLGMWLFLATEVLFFSGLFVAYATYRNLHPEVFVSASEHLNTTLGAINTIVLLFSSLTMAWGVRSAQLGNSRALVLCLTVTLACAGFFLGVKTVEYGHKAQEGLLWAGAYSAQDHAAGAHPASRLMILAALPGIILSLVSALMIGRARRRQFARGQAFWLGLLMTGAAIVVGYFAAEFVMAATEPHVVSASHTAESAAADAVTANHETPTTPVAATADNEHGSQNLGRFFSIYFGMTGVHALHIIGGMIAIGWLLHRTLRGDFGPGFFGPVDFVGLYWHLVDLVWIYLFPLLYLIG